MIATAVNAVAVIFVIVISVVVVLVDVVVVERLIAVASGGGIATYSPAIEAVAVVEPILLFVSNTTSVTDDDFSTFVCKFLSGIRERDKGTCRMSFPTSP